MGAALLPRSTLLCLAGLAGLGGGLGGCTIVNVHSEAGVRTRYYPGVAVIRITPSDTVQVVEVESIGATAVGNHANLGWIHSQIALVPAERCQFIAWRVEREQVAALRGLFGPGTEICDREGGTR